MKPFSCSHLAIRLATALAALALPSLAVALPLHSDGFETGHLCVWSEELSSYQESFSLPQGSAWPAGWASVGSVDVADIDSGRARFRPTPSGYSLARLVAAVDTRDVEVEFTFVFEDAATQGVGFYVRQNGGYLHQSNPAGQGYAVFVEHFRGTPGIGLWKEIDGAEIPLHIEFDEALEFVSGSPYRVRFRVNQVDPTTTLLQARAWPVGSPEPSHWQVSLTDGTPELQGISGMIALDSWSSIQSPGPIVAHTLIDDIVVRPLCNPLSGHGSVDTLTESLQFSEGPLWRGDHLLFSDIDANTIYRLDPPATITTFRTPSDQSNGLSQLSDGRLVAAEHGTRSVSRTELNQTVTTLADSWQGLRFNSPNDLAVRSDDTVYFTDPDYGLSAPEDREISFNGVFRVDPNGLVTAEWQGDAATERPNGIALSPDQSVLYVSVTDAGTVLAFDVVGDGSLSNQRTFASGLQIPDGLCVDRLGNVFVATWANAIQVYEPSGAPFGAIDLSQNATNCAFGGPSGRTLYITAGTGVYSVELLVPGF